MRELGLAPDGPKINSAWIVDETMGDYHPPWGHGRVRGAGELVGIQGDILIAW